MHNLTFYHQVRFDGGSRTGVSVDDDSSSLHHFMEGSGDHDPRLLWYLDLRCEGPSLPDDPRAAQAWFVAHEAFFVEVVNRTADSIEIGLDAGLWPFRQSLPGPEAETQCRVTVHAVRRLEGLDVAVRLRDLARRWIVVLDQLAPLVLQ